MDEIEKIDKMLGRFPHGDEECSDEENKLSRKRLTKEINKMIQTELAKQQKINNEVLADKCDEMERMILEARIDELDICPSGGHICSKQAMERIEFLEQQLKENK